jgi:hypothetical protein
MNSVVIIKDFFDEAWWVKVKNFEKTQIYSDRWITNHQFFPAHYVDGPGAILINFVQGPFDIELADYMVSKKWLKYRPNFFHALLYRGLTGSFVKWHKDGLEDNTKMQRTAFSIYLNDEWDSHWGGWFSWKEPNELYMRSYSPEKNSAVALLEDVEHCTTPIGPTAKFQRTSIQLFFEKDALNIEYLKSQ